jgi:Ala-tRNA(Pro) deacylase
LKTTAPAPANRACLEGGAQHLNSQEQEVYEHLERLGIAFVRHEHPPVSTVEEANQHWAGIDAMHFKNLFLRNQKGDRHYLAVVQSAKRVDLKSLATQIGDGRLSFGSPQRLLTCLALTPGSVSPFGLMNDRDHSVRVLLDRDLKTAPRVAFHPNINTATLSVATADFLRFLDTCGNPVQYVTV